MPKKSLIKKILKIGLYILCSVLLLFVLIILFIRSPKGQSIIVKQATAFVSDKTNTTVEIGKLYVTFSGNILLEKLFLDDLSGDTLIYSERLEASIALVPLIFDKNIVIDFLEWEGVRANILRTGDSEKFNYNFLIDAFASSSDSSSSPPPTIDIGQIHLIDISLVYNDHRQGIESNYALKDLDFEAEEIDLETMRFEVEALKIAGAYVNFKETKLSEKEPGTEANVLLPFFEISTLSLSDIHVHYRSVPGKINSKFDIGSLAVANTSLDLNRQQIKSKYFELANSGIAIQTIPQETKDSTASPAFEWPQWEIDLQEISLSDNRFKLKTSGQISNPDSFDLRNMNFSEIHFKANNLRYRAKDLTGSLTAFSFREGDEFKLNNLSFDLNIKANRIDLKQLKIATANNKLEGDIYLAFASLQELVKNPSLTTVTADLPAFTLNAGDFYYFLPKLRTDTLITKISKNDLTGQLKIKGDLKELSIPKIELQWGSSTRLSASGEIKELLDSTKLNYSISNLNVHTEDQDILRFVNKEKIGVKIPRKVHLTGNIAGSLSGVTGNAALNLPEGKLEVVGEFNFKHRISFDGKVVAQKLNIGQLLNNSKLGLLTLHLEAKGTGKTLNTLDAQFTSTVESFRFNNYHYQGLQLAGEVTKGKGNLEASFKDRNLNTTLTSTFKLDTSNTVIDADLKVIGADLYALGLSKKMIKGKFGIDIHFENQKKDLALNAGINEGEVVYNGESHALGNVVIIAKSNSKSTTAKITGDFLNMEMAANASYTKLIDALKNQITGYFVKKEPKLPADSVQMNLNLTLSETPVLTKVFVEELQFEPIQLSLNFNQADYELNAMLNAPAIKYKENEVDSISFTAAGDRDNLNFSLGFSELCSGPVNLPKTTFTCVTNDSITLLDFVVAENSEKLMQINSEIRRKDNSLIYHINPEKLILNKMAWDILPNNELKFSKNKIVAKDFQFQRNEQQVKIKTFRAKNNTETVELSFDDFNLVNLTGFLNRKEPIASGILQGNIAIENPTKERGLVSNLEITNFKVLDILLGKLELSAVARQGKKYKINLAVNGKDIDLAVDGNYSVIDKEGHLDFDFALDRLNIGAFEKLTATYVSDLKGLLSANATLGGTLKNPQYKGEIYFKESSFNINKLNAPFRLDNETITFATDKITFRNFLIKDLQNNKFHIDGIMLTENMTNPSFDLTIKAKQFQVLNSTVKDNQLFYGKVNLNTDLSIKGDLNIPVVRGQLSINKNSNFTYIVPEEKLELKEREGVLLFVNKENPDAILTRQDESESSSAVVKGFDINTTLKVNDNVDFNIIIDERSGDKLNVKGDGDFVIGLEPNGILTFSGRYELTDGYYETGLYNIVKRRFDIAKGSYIEWKGSPLDANINIRAIYEVDASPSSLMAIQNAGQGIEATRKYNKKVPFLVYLDLKGELLKPKISFQMDMPESSRGEFGGQVYSKVQQLNNNEEELNKQVFSLLVLNRFFPQGSNDGSGGGSVAMARGNVNKVLENQLNQFSEKYLDGTGVELDFGVDSYTDYQGESPQDKTQVDVNARKKLFDDKLIVQVGSEVNIAEKTGATQVGNQVIGNISLEYLITENGRWRIKGFRKNEFESVIDGQLIVTGIALIFQREFNQFSDLIEEIKKNEPQAEEENRNEK